MTYATPVRTVDCYAKVSVANGTSNVVHSKNFKVVLMLSLKRTKHLSKILS